MLFTPGAFVLLLSHSEGRRRPAYAFLASSQFRKGPAFSLHRWFSEREGTYLDIPMPNECDSNLAGRAREAKGLAGCGLPYLSLPFSPTHPDELKIKSVKERLIYSKLFESKMEALFIKLWVFLPQRKTSKITHALPPESCEESYKGTFVGIKEKHTPQHLSLALAVGGLQTRGLGKALWSSCGYPGRDPGLKAVPSRGPRCRTVVHIEVIFLNGLKIDW